MRRSGIATDRHLTWHQWRTDDRRMPYYSAGPEPGTGVNHAYAGQDVRTGAFTAIAPVHSITTGVNVIAAGPSPRTGPHSRERRSACTDRLKCYDCASRR